MIRSLKLIAYIAFGALLLGAALLAGKDTSAVSGTTVTVIVELQDEPAAVYAARARQAGTALSDEQIESYRSSLRVRQDQFLQALAGNGVAAQIRSREIRDYDGAVAGSVALRYTYVYNGMALDVPSAAVDAIKAMPAVKSVHFDEVLRPELHRSVRYINAQSVYGGVHELTPFDNLREGYEGFGINISIIDTGIDWTHPMFGGDPTPPRLAVQPSVAAFNTNQKVIYYLPLADIAINDGFGHGTHVASTAAGYLAQHPGSDGIPLTADDIRLHGVAPQAKLLSYKVCSDVVSTIDQVTPVGGCFTSNTIMALEDSVSPFSPNGLPKPVAHVINMSLGGSGSPDSPSAVAASNAALAGAIVVASAGNSGAPSASNPTGEGTVGAPSVGRHVISVAANTHPGSAASQWSSDLLQASAFSTSRTGAVTPANSFPVAPGTARYRLFPMLGTAGLPAGGMAQRYVYIDRPLVAWPTSVSGRIALVRAATGATNFDIVAQATNAGAVGVVISDSRGAVNGIRTLIPAATIAPANFEVLVDALSSTDDDSVNPPNGALSELPLRMNPFFTDQFVGEMGGFSSKGPVRGFGQVKPDVSAPGVAVLAGVPPASLLGAIGAIGGVPNYIAINGTSMSAPHVAGAVALVKQAHPTWSPDMVRTAMINTATNMRDGAGVPKADSLTVERILSQGGGLIDIREAINAKALMGVEGDGIATPGILGSHSYGEVPVINSRITHTIPVTVAIRDLSGEGGTYNLAVVNNRDLQLAGISVALSQSNVSVPPGGRATFTVSASVDGDLLRDVMVNKTIDSQTILERLQMQWYVTANRSDNAESLRMPFYFRPGQSLPAQTTTDSTTQTAIVPVGDVGNQTATGLTYVDVPFTVSPTTFNVEVTTSWLEVDAPVGGAGLPDIDYQLLDPAGNIIASSGAFGGPEYVNVRVNTPGTYRHRLVGYVNAATQCTIVTNFTRGGTPPTLNGLTGDFVSAAGKQIDFDGAFTLSWQGGTGQEQGYEIDRSSNGTNWTQIAAVGSSQTSLALTSQPDGEHFFRVRALIPGQVGLFETRPSNTTAITVSRRVKEDITALVQSAISNVSFTGGVFQFDQTLRNNSANAYLPLVDLNIVKINSASGTVAAINADNGGDGKSAATPALYDYSRRLGADEVFSAGETSAARTMQFSNPRSELFTFDAVITAYRGGTGASSDSAEAGAGMSEATASSSGDPIQSLTAVIRFTADPLTGTVTAQLVSLSH